MLIKKPFGHFILQLKVVKISFSQISPNMNRVSVCVCVDLEVTPELGRFVVEFFFFPLSGLGMMFL